MLKDIQSNGKKDTRSGFGDGIAELGRTNKDVVALTADLAGFLNCTSSSASSCAVKAIS